MEISAVSDIPALDAWLKEHSLNGHWNHEGEREDFQAALWKWDDIHSGLMKAAELVPMDATGGGRFRCAYRACATG